MCDEFSLISGIVGIVVGVVGVIISVLFYLRAKEAGKRTEAQVGDTLKIVASSQAVLDTTKSTIVATQAALEAASADLRELLELHALELSSDTTDNFIEGLVDRANLRGQALTVGDVRKSLRSTRWTQTDGRQALRRLRGRLQFDGSLDDASTVIRQ